MALFRNSHDLRLAWRIHDPAANGGKGGTLVLDPGETAELPDDTEAAHLELAEAKKAPEAPEAIDPPDTDPTVDPDEPAAA